MVHEYKKNSQTFEEVKAENMDLKNSSVEPSTTQLGETDSLQIEMSKLKNESLRLRSCELEYENERLNLVMSSWTQSSVSLSKLHETQKPLNDKSDLGFNAGESSSGETCTQSNLVYDKFKKMNFVKASVIHDTCESVRYDDQTSGQLNQKGKAGIGYVRPVNSKSSWLKNKLDKEKAKAGSKSFVQNQQRRGSKKVKSEWRKVQSRRYLNGPHIKPKLNRSHHIPAHTHMDFHTRKTVKYSIRIQVSDSNHWIQQRSTGHPLANSTDTYRYAIRNWDTLTIQVSDSNHWIQQRSTGHPLANSTDTYRYAIRNWDTLTTSWGTTSWVKNHDQLSNLGSLKTTQTRKTTKPQRDMGSNPSTESN
ncbi:hypothetical protein F511_42568 [Dorcoceras hygrometricum]|uniref:Uncharacterized protein n=1 Tax=Dorcoceras hygrometricum TaxID=472368 RepID=A0A2Z7BBA4_9LAMI|nr:hypothetical protein F511_42568 [Dorcoceras hygrometricum]